MMSKSSTNMVVVEQKLVPHKKAWPEKHKQKYEVDSHLSHPPDLPPNFMLSFFDITHASPDC